MELLAKFFVIIVTIFFSDLISKHIFSFIKLSKYEKNINFYNWFIIS